MKETAIKDTALFTQAAAARAVGVERQAVTNRFMRNKWAPGETIEIHGSTLITGLGVKRWKKERDELEKKESESPQVSPKQESTV